MSGAPDTAPPDGATHQATHHRGLTYPLGRTAPGPGQSVAVAPGVGWARMPMGGRLGHINCYLLDDADGAVTIVDTGLDDAATRAAWDALVAGPLAGRRVARIVVTHFHPDHVGMAGALAARLDAPIAMTRGEYLLARLLMADASDTPPPEAFAYWRLAGWEEARIAAAAAEGWGRFASAVAPLPISYLRLSDGDALAIGARRWRVVVGSGHSPEHACLADDAGTLLLAGDQVLPRITSNVSLSLTEPFADPLGEWLASIDRLRALPGDPLVLPSHGEPFIGLAARLDALAGGHRLQLDRLLRHLDRPRRAIDCFGPLFARGVGEGVYGLATGEALAHLRHLEVTGRAVREMRGAVAWFRAA